MPDKQYFSRGTIVGKKKAAGLSPAAVVVTVPMIRTILTVLTHK